MNGRLYAEVPAGIAAVSKGGKKFVTAEDDLMVVDWIDGALVSLAGGSLFVLAEDVRVVAGVKR